MDKGEEGCPGPREQESILMIFLLGEDDAEGRNGLFSSFSVV